MLKSHLRQLMAEHKINDISELMDKTGVSRNSINKLYREVEMETLKLETLIQICDSFKISLSELVEYDPDYLIFEDDAPIEELAQEIHEMLVRGMQSESKKSQELRKKFIEILNKNKPE